MSPVLWRYTELTYTVHMLSILYTVYSIMTVSLNLAIIYATALRWLYFIFNALLLFLKILYNKIICPVLTVC